jgi:ArsR family transcriptional regulator
MAGCGQPAAPVRDDGFGLPAYAKVFFIKHCFMYEAMVNSDLVTMRAYTRALASRTRLLTLDELSSDTELDVSELSRRIGVSQPLMSWHLRRLRRAGLVRARRQGRRVLYALDRPTLGARHAALTNLIDELTATDTRGPNAESAEPAHALA